MNGGMEALRPGSQDVPVIMSVPPGAVVMAEFSQPTRAFIMPNTLNLMAKAVADVLDPDVVKTLDLWRDQVENKTGWRLCKAVIDSKATGHILGPVGPRHTAFAKRLVRMPEFVGYTAMIDFGPYNSIKVDGPSGRLKRKFLDPIYWKLTDQFIEAFLQACPGLCSGSLILQGPKSVHEQMARLRAL